MHETGIFNMEFQALGVKSSLDGWESFFDVKSEGGVVNTGIGIVDRPAPLLSQRPTIAHGSWHRLAEIPHVKSRELGVFF